MLQEAIWIYKIFVTWRKRTSGRQKQDQYLALIHPLIRYWADSACAINPSSLARILAKRPSN